MMKSGVRSFAPFLLLSVLALLTGLWAGLVRLGWQLPALSANLPMQHGPLMISGFLGTLIALERVAALRRSWMYLAPLTSGFGWILGLALPGSLHGPLLMTTGSLMTVAILAVMVRTEPVIHTAIIASGTLCWLVGNVLWISGLPVYQVVWWWAAFLILTIAGERLELSRVLRPTRNQHRLFLLAAALFFAGIVTAIWNLDIGARITGFGLVALAAWLLRFDLARRNLRHPLPLTRFIAVCLFSGYLWLGFAGLLSLVLGALYAGPWYDAVLHSIFVGFVMSMIFGHAPIIFPALARVPVQFNPSLYLPLILLHASLALRILGDLSGWTAVRLWGGLLNETAILLFFGLFAYGTAVSSRKTGKRSQAKQTQ